jgi:hypothetical protein
LACREAERLSKSNLSSIRVVSIRDQEIPLWELVRCSPNRIRYLVITSYLSISAAPARSTNEISPVNTSTVAGGETVAAGEFLADERHMEQLLKQAPRDWQKKNMEVVLETQVIQVATAHPRVRAVHIW